MTFRFHHLAAAAALTALTAAQALAATFGTITYKAEYPQLQTTACFTRYFFTSTSTAIYARRCDSGEISGTVRVVYVAELES